MKIKATALAQKHFKAPVIVTFPTENLTAKGDTEYATAKFIGLFRTLSVEEARKNLAELQEVQKGGDLLESVEVHGKQVASYFIGFEPMPGKEFPITDDNDQALTSSAENIQLLLNSRELASAVTTAYEKARSEDVLGKNSKR